VRIVLTFAQMWSIPNLVGCSFSCKPSELLERMRPFLLPVEVQNSQIVDWWEAERYFVWSECTRQNRRLTDMANEVIDGLSTKDTFWIKSDARDDLKRKIGAELELHNRRMAEHLTASYEKSIGNIEALAALDGASSGEYATVAAGLVAGAGALGLAVGAGAFAPTTAVLFFVVPVGALGSWPVFAALGLGAVSAAWVSPKIGAYATRVVRDRYKRAIQVAIKKSLLSEDDTGQLSSWKMFSTQLDDLLRSRMHKKG